MTHNTQLRDVRSMDAVARVVNFRILYHPTQSNLNESGNHSSTGVIGATS